VKELLFRDREARKRAAAKLQRHLRTSAGLSQPQVAAATGIQVGRLYKMEDPEEESTLSVADLLVLPPPMARDLLAVLADQLGCVLVQRAPAGASVEDQVQALAAAFKERGEAQTELASLLTEPVPTPSRLARVRKEHLEAEQAEGRALELMASRGGKR
jgi:transcriptional regulator with XRE-family HTH domain